MRARRIPVLLLVIVLAAGVLRFGRGQLFLVPALVGRGESHVVWSTLVPLAWSAVLSSTFGSLVHPVEQRTAQRRAGLDLALYLMATMLLCSAATVSSPRAMWSQQTVPALVLGGLAVAVTARWGPARGAMTATAVALATVAYGPRAPGGRFVCFLEPDAHRTFATALALFATAAAAGVLLGRRRSRWESAA